MRLRKLALAIPIVGALGAILASSAFAKVATETASWYEGTPTTVITKDTPIKLKAASHVMDNGVASTKITAKLRYGTGETWLQATGVECVGCNITNRPESSEMAMAKGKIKFTGVTVVEPKPCAVEGGTVETTEVIAHADYMHEGKAFVKFEPAKGPTTAFATIKINGCEALNTTLVVKGLVFGEVLNKTGVAAEEQGITFDEATHKTTESTLNINEKATILDGAEIAELNPTTSFGINTP